VERLSTGNVDMFLADGFMGKSVFSNMTGTTGEGKARDFYTILSGCPQI